MSVLAGVLSLSVVLALGEVVLAMPDVLVSLGELGVVLVVALMSVLELGDGLLVGSVEAAREVSVDGSGEVSAVLDGSVTLVFEVGFVELVVFRLPLVFSLVVLVVAYGEVEDGVEALDDAEYVDSVLLEGELYAPGVELLVLGAAEED